MSFSFQDPYYNIVLLDDLLAKSFARDAIDNLVEAKDYIVNYLNQHELSLFAFNGEQHQKFLVDAIKRSLQNKHFDVQKAASELDTYNRQIVMLEEDGTQRYLNQPQGGISILEQLHEKGFVDPRYWLTDRDMSQALSFFLSDNMYTTPISLDNSIDELKSCLTDNQTFPLYIPVNMNRNHWILFKLDTDQRDGHPKLLCWDPVEGNETRLHSDLADLMHKMTLAVTEIYGDHIDIKYEFGNEQKDGITCGYRVIQKVMKDRPDVDHPFKHIPADNPDRMYVEFIKFMAQHDAQLQNVSDSLVVVVEDNISTVYRNDGEFSDHAEVQDKIDSKRATQERTDKLLAIVLQDIYLRDPDIETQSAMDLAQEKIRTTKVSDIEKREKEIAVELLQKQDQYTIKTSTASTLPFFKSGNRQPATSSGLVGTCRSESENRPFEQSVTSPVTA